MKELDQSIMKIYNTLDRSESIKSRYHFGMFKGTSMQIVKSAPLSLSEYEKSASTIFYGSGINVNNSDGSGQENGDDLFVKIRWYLIFGRILGLVPCKGVFQKNLHHFKYKFRSLAAFTTLFMSGLLIFSALMGTIGMCRAWKRNASELASAAADPLFYFVGSFIFIHFLRRGEEFSNLFEKWSEMKFNFPLTDKSLSKHCGILAVILLTSAILENAVMTLQQMLDPSDDPKESWFQLYYKRNHKYWKEFIPFHEFGGILAFISNKGCIYAWNYLDVLIAIVSRAIYQKFKMLNEAAEAAFPKDAATGRTVGFGMNPQLLWSKLIQDHATLCDILLDFQSFLSPLIFLTYAANIFFACLQLMWEFNDSNEESLIQSIYVSWSFIHLLVRGFIMSYYAAKVNVYAHQISQVLEKCPVEYYTTEIERFERKLYLTEIGFGGLGCFTVTKPLNLGIIGVILTFEIVLLQSLPYNNGGNKNSPP